ncbi:hypothetical protein [Caminibacter sp.]
MANWSDTLIYIRGEKEKIQKVKEIIDSMLEKDNYGDTWLVPTENKVLEIFGEFKEEIEKIKKENSLEYNGGLINSMIMDKYEVKHTEIVIKGQGRWNAPDLFFKLLAKKLELGLEFFDAELGSDYSYLLIMKNGKIVKEVFEKFYSPLSVEYLYGGNIEDFIEYELDWYFEEDEKIDEIEELLRIYGVDKENLAV